MPYTPKTQRSVHSRHSSRHRSSHHTEHPAYREPVYYFSGMIVLLILVKLMHAYFLPTVIGALGIVLLPISKQWKFKAGVIIAVILMLTMVMLFNWNWADFYFIAILSAELVAQPQLFINGLVDTAIPILLIWIFQRQMNAIHIRSSQKWFIKKSYVKFFRLLLYFQLFLLLFWILALLLLKSRPFTGLNPVDSTIIAGALGALAAGIPTIIFITKGSGELKTRHRRHHRHRDTQSADGKNAEPSEK